MEVTGRLTGFKVDSVPHAGHLALPTWWLTTAAM
jgi:hypothetical protein